MLIYRLSINLTKEGIFSTKKSNRSGPSAIMLESKNRNRGTPHQKTKAKESFSSSVTMTPSQRVSLHLETCMTLHSLSETLQTTTALPSSPLYPSPAPRTYLLHVDTTDIYLHISQYSSARGILCACVFLVQQKSESSPLRCFK